MSLQHLVTEGINMMENQSNPEDVLSILGRYFQNHNQPNQQQSSDINWKPSVDISENSNSIKIYCCIPGVKSDTVDVDFYNNKIKISGERDKPYLDDDIIKQEIVYGKFERNITIPINVTKRDSVNVSSKNGLLCITINKASEEENKFNISLHNDDTGNGKKKNEED
jgi:HSP20 family molecular chaperone IbpA